MSLTDREWIVIMDDLEDAQSVTSCVHSEVSTDYVCCESSLLPTPGDEAPVCNKLPQKYPTSDNVNQLVVFRNSACPLQECDGTLRTMVVLTLEWLSSTLFLSDRATASGIGILTHRYIPTVGVVNHNGCISPDLGRTASTQLRACGLVGSLYTPDADSLVGIHKQRERARLLRTLRCP
jgi:hypothetical protein